MAGPSQVDGSGASSTSASLLARVRERDDIAWAQLIELYAPLVYFWCNRADIPEQDIPDVLQDVFRSVVANIHVFRNDRPSDTFRGWLRTVTRSRLTDYFRRQRRTPDAAGGSEAHLRLQQIIAPVDATEEDEELQENALLRRGLEQIRTEFDPRTFQAFWRVVVDGLSTADVAEELAMRPGTVRVAKSRVLQRLRRQLGDVE